MDPRPRFIVSSERLEYIIKPMTIGFQGLHHLFFTECPTVRSVSVRVLHPTNKQAMEIWPQLKNSSARLEDRRIKPATFGLQGQHANHYATAAPSVKV